MTSTLAGTIGETIDLIEAAGGRAIGVVADLEDRVQRDGLIDDVLDRTGRIDILVNNAGFADYSVIEEMSLETFDRTIEHYLRTPFVLTKAAVPHMRNKGAGWIVNIGRSPAWRRRARTGTTTRPPAMSSMPRARPRCIASPRASRPNCLDANIAVNCVGPSTAVRTPGAAQLIPDTFPTEPVEYLAETVLAMCHLPAAERTGLVAFSLHYPWSQNLPVHSLDGARYCRHWSRPRRLTQTSGPPGCKEVRQRSLTVQQKLWHTRSRTMTSGHSGSNQRSTTAQWIGCIR